MFFHYVLLDEGMASWENFSSVFCFISLLIVTKLSDVCFEVWFLSLPVGQLFHCCVFLRVRGPTERQLLWPVCLRLQFVWQIYSKRVQILLFLMKHFIKCLGASLV